MEIEKYIKSGLRSIAASVPIAASLAHAWNEYEAITQYQRIEDFFYWLKGEIDLLKDKLNEVENYIQHSGDVPPLIEDIVERVRKEKSERKRRYFGRLLLNTIIEGSKIAYEEKRILIETLDSITTKDLHVLHLFQENEQHLVEDLIISMISRRITPPEIVKNSLTPEKEFEVLSSLSVSFSKLQSRGLIAETVGPRDEGVMSRVYEKVGWQEKLKEKYFEILPYGILFSKMVPDQIDVKVIDGLVHVDFDDVYDFGTVPRS